MNVLEDFQGIKKSKIHPLTDYDIKQFVLERFDGVKAQEKMKDLIHFHSINKYLLMSHDPKGLNKLGNIIANHDEKSFKEIIIQYEYVLKNTLEKNPTTKANSNTLYHIFGNFSQKLSTPEKIFILNMLQEYHSGKIPLEKILYKMKIIVAKLDKKYLIRQTYFLFNVRRVSPDLN